METIKAYPNTGILLKDEIIEGIYSNIIVMEPFNVSMVGPNSCDLHIGDTIITYNRNKVYMNPHCYRTMEYMREHNIALPQEYKDSIIDLKNALTYETTMIKIPESGYLLLPDQVYLINTKERFGSNKFVPIVTGRSSIGRLGISVHQEAGFGDLGYIGTWTLQLSVTYPTKIYPNLRLAQVYFITAFGHPDKENLYKGKYLNSKETVQASKLYMDPDMK